MALAVKAGLSELADKWLTVPDYFGANAGLKVTALVAGCWPGPIPSMTWPSPATTG